MQQNQGFDIHNFWEYVFKKSNDLRTKEFENRAKEMESRAKMLLEKYKKINEYEIDNFEVRFEIKYDTIPSQASGEIKLNYKRHEQQQ
jgi:hypothetical protein